VWWTIGFDFIVLSIFIILNLFAILWLFLGIILRSAFAAQVSKLNVHLWIPFASNQMAAERITAQPNPSPKPDAFWFSVCTWEPQVYWQNERISYLLTYLASQLGQTFMFSFIWLDPFILSHFALIMINIWSAFIVINSLISNFLRFRTQDDLIWMNFNGLDSAPHSNIKDML